jgi:hypothetical protein
VLRRWGTLGCEFDDEAVVNSTGVGRAHLMRCNAVQICRQFRFFFRTPLSYFLPWRVANEGQFVLLQSALKGSVLR